MNREIKGVIICGFPGIGKSTAASNRSDICDSESSCFHAPAIVIEDGKATTRLVQTSDKEKDWEKAYVDSATTLASDIGYEFVLISCHKKVRNELKRRGVPYVVVVPEYALKNEYLIRYLKRGDKVEFIKLVSDNWDDWLNEIYNEDAPVIELKEGQVLADILPPIAQALR